MVCEAENGLSSTSKQEITRHNPSHRAGLHPIPRPHPTSNFLTAWGTREPYSKMRDSLNPKFQHSADQFFRIALVSFDNYDALKVS